jgi:hypothetical protein
MSTNFYFQSGIPGGRTGEQRLVEGLIIESIKIYGFDLYYLPRTEVNLDQIFLEDPAGRYENAIPIEGYLEQVDGYGGDGALMQKFGIEIRDTATFVIARSRWEDTVARGRSNYLALPNRPAEGDILFMPLTNSYFEVKKVDAHDPFYQLGKLYVYKMQCELLQYSGEEFNTGLDSIDRLEDEHSLDLLQHGLELEDGAGVLILDSNQEETGTLLREDFILKTYDPQSDNDEFNRLAALDILDFTEINPFGEIATR